MKYKDIIVHVQMIGPPNQFSGGTTTSLYIKPMTESSFDDSSLTDSDIKSFHDHIIRGILEEGTGRFARYFGGTAAMSGGYLSNRDIPDIESVRSMLQINPEWGNTCQNQAFVHLLASTRIMVGQIAGSEEMQIRVHSENWDKIKFSAGRDLF